MADFCAQCSEEMGFPASGDLANITTELDWLQGLAAVVICESCGPIQVDPKGRCISKDCYENHGLKADVPLPSP